MAVVLWDGRAKLVSFEGCSNEARGTIDKFECSLAPPSDLQLFSVAGERATKTPFNLRRAVLLHSPNRMFRRLYILSVLARCAKTFRTFEIQHVACVMYYGPSPLILRGDTCAQQRNACIKAAIT